MSGPALEDEGVGPDDVHVVGAVDDQHRRVAALVEQAAGLLAAIGR